MTTSSPSPVIQPAPALGGTSAKALLFRWIDIIGPLLALFAVFFFFLACIGTRFASFDSIETMCRQSTIVCMAGLGMTFVIISAGIDLSVGSAVAVCAVTLAVLLKMTHADPADASNSILLLRTYPIGWPLFCLIAAIVSGVVFGFINGALITWFRLAPFIATLATMMIYRGLTEGVSNQQAVNPPPNWTDKILAAPILPHWIVTSPLKPVLEYLYLAPGVWMTIILAVIMAVVLNYTRYGRHLIALGSNEQTARLCGIPVNRMKLTVYAIGGLFAGFAAIMQYSRTSQASPSAGIGLELDVIAAVVIGGASLNGGKGSILGTIVGSLIMTVIASGCSQIPVPHFVQDIFTHMGQTPSAFGLPSWIQKIVTGLIIIVAVSLDNLRQRRPS